MTGARAEEYLFDDTAASKEATNPRINILAFTNSDIKLGDKG